MPHDWNTIFLCACFNVILNGRHDFRSLFFQFLLLFFIQPVLLSQFWYDFYICLYTFALAGPSSSSSTHALRGQFNSILLQGLLYCCNCSHTISFASILTGQRLWLLRYRPIGHGTIVQCCCVLSFSFFSQNLGSMSFDSQNSFTHEFQNVRASIERHGPRPVFQLPWENGVWKCIFNPHPSPLSLISRSLSLPSSFSDPSNSNSMSSNVLDSHSSQFTSNFKPDFSSSFISSSSIPSILPSQQLLSSNSFEDEPCTEFWSRFFGYSDMQQGCSDGLRHLAVSRLISMLATSTGSTMFLSSSDPWDLHASFSAALSMKATSTIIKRSLDLLRFKNGCDLHNKQFTPFSELILWQFLRELQQTARPSSSELRHSCSWLPVTATLFGFSAHQGPLCWSQSLGVTDQACTAFDSSADYSTWITSLQCSWPLFKTTLWFNSHRSLCSLSLERPSRSTFNWLWPWRIFTTICWASVSTCQNFGYAG